MYKGLPSATVKRRPRVIARDRSPEYRRPNPQKRSRDGLASTTSNETLVRKFNCSRRLDLGDLLQSGGCQARGRGQRRPVGRKAGGSCRRKDERGARAVEVGARVILSCARRCRLRGLWRESSAYIALRGEGGVGGRVASGSSVMWVGCDGWTPRSRGFDSRCDVGDTLVVCAGS